MKTAMLYRLIALLFVILGVGVGLIIVRASGANTPAKEILGLAVPTMAGLMFAVAWWRKGSYRQ